MKGLTWILAALAAAIGGYLGYTLVLDRTPGVIMNRVMEVLAERGASRHSFNLGPRITPESQTVVRPSPDFAYSICMFDFTSGVDALEVVAGPWPPYGSLSFFDANTNNFATLRAEDGARTVLAAPGVELDGEHIAAPTDKGLILIRRLAASADAHAAVAAGPATQDRCAPPTS
ncbi:MAG: DUF1254 domain-containing protein [Pseudomonadota bacterium]